MVATVDVMKIGVLGAGLIGCYLGGALAAKGASVVLVGRARVIDQIRADGLKLSDLNGNAFTLAPEQIIATTSADALSECELVLVTVKSLATTNAAHDALAHLAPAAMVLSCQNGIRNADALRAVFPNHTVLACMVPFNVAQLADGSFHRSTEGELMVQADPRLAPYLPLFASAGLRLEQRQDMAAVMWGKLLLNLNNPLNALSGIPLREQLAQRDYRRCLAMVIDEGLLAMRAAGIHPAKVTALPPRWLPALLRLPDWLFTRLAARMLKMDPQARSSMWDDFVNHRPTEIDFINGEIVRLAERVGTRADANRCVIELVRAAENGALESHPGAELWAALRAGR